VRTSLSQLAPLFGRERRPASSPDPWVLFRARTKLGRPNGDAGRQSIIITFPLAPLAPAARRRQDNARSVPIDSSAGGGRFCCCAQICALASRNPFSALSAATGQPCKRPPRSAVCAGQLRQSTKAARPSCARNGRFQQLARPNSNPRRFYTFIQPARPPAWCLMRANFRPPPHNGRSRPALGASAC